MAEETDVGPIEAGGYECASSAAYPGLLFDPDTKTPGSQYHPKYSFSTLNAYVP